MAKTTESTQFTQINNNHIKAIGYELSGFLAYLYSKQSYYRDKQSKDLLNGKWFYRTIESVMEDTGLSKEQQTRLVSRLKSLGLIDSCTMYSPQSGQKTRYFYVPEIDFQNTIIDQILKDKQEKPKKPKSECNFSKGKKTKESRSEISELELKTSVLLGVNSLLG